MSTTTTHGVKRKLESPSAHSSDLTLIISNFNQVFKNRQNKLNPLWYGPFKVIGQPSTVSFTLELPNDSKIHDTFHVSKLKLASDKSFSSLTQKKVLIPTNEEDDGDYEVERLLDHYWDPRTKSYYYLVKWKGFSELFESRCRASNLDVRAY